MNSRSDEPLPDMVRRIVAEAAVKAGARKFGNLSDEEVNRELRTSAEERSDWNGRSWSPPDFHIPFELRMADRGGAWDKSAPRFFDRGRNDPSANVERSDA